MKKSIIFSAILLVTAVIFSLPLSAQKIAFIASDIIRDKFPEAKAADQRVRSMVDEWKRELEDMEKKIEDAKFEIRKNRLIWSDEEKKTKDKELEELQVQKLEFARRKFEAGGEYDATVKQMMSPIEEKIYAAVQQVAADEGYDIIWDKSQNPLPYSNSKFDMTVKVLRRLGVDVKALEKELQEKIDKDPRNAKKDTKAAPGKRTRASGTQKKDIQREDGLSDPNKPNPMNPQKPHLDPNKGQSIEIDTTVEPSPLLK